MTAARVERPLFSELFGPLVGLEEEWRAQGASAAELDLSAFDWDWVPVAQLDLNGLIGGHAEQTLVDTDESLVWRDRLGRTVKLCKRTATIGLPMDYPVHDATSWEPIRSWFAFDESRIDPERIEQLRRERDAGAIVVAHMGGAFNMLRELMGDENACTAYLEQPELVHDVLSTLGATAVEVLDRLAGRTTIDQLSVHEDLAGKNGPLVGPRQVREFFEPYFRPVWERCRGLGGVVFDMDSDGNVEPILDALLECGLNSMHPFEPVPGMDIVALRRRYGRRLMMRGGIDKHVLRRGKAAIRAELERKLDPDLRTGGVVFALDHRIPNGTPLDAYRYYVDLGREMLGLPPRRVDGGWGRMAF